MVKITLVSQIRLEVVEQEIVAEVGLLVVVSPFEVKVLIELVSSHLDGGFLRWCKLGKLVRIVHSGVSVDGCQSIGLEVVLVPIPPVFYLLDLLLDKLMIRSIIQIVIIILTTLQVSPPFCNIPLQPCHSELRVGDSS